MTLSAIYLLFSQTQWASSAKPRLPRPPVLLRSRLAPLPHQTKHPDICLVEQGSASGTTAPTNRLSTVSDILRHAFPRGNGKDRICSDCQLFSANSSLAILRRAEADSYSCRGRTHKPASSIRAGTYRRETTDIG